MAALTWKNVNMQPSSAASDMAKLAVVLGGAGEKVSDALQGIHDRKSDRITGEGLAQIMAMDDYESSGQEFAQIMQGMDTRYADMGALAEAGQKQRTNILEDNQLAFDVKNQQEVYDLTKRLTEAQIGSRNRQHTGTAGTSGTATAGTLTKADMVLMAAEQDPMWANYSAEEQMKKLGELGTTHNVGLRGLKFSYENRYGLRDKLAKEDRDKASKFKKSTLLTAPDDLNAPNLSGLWPGTKAVNDREAKTQYDTLAKYLQRDLKMSQTESREILDAGFNTGLNWGGIFGPLSGGGWDRTNDPLQEALRAAEIRHLTGSTPKDNPIALKTAASRK